MLKPFELTLTCQSADNKLKNRSFIRKFLSELPNRIKMRKISKPDVMFYSDCPSVDQGISGFVMIAESHIAIHTWPNRDHFWVKIFSCKKFDIKQVKKDVEKEFSAKIISSHLYQGKPNSALASQESVHQPQTAH